MTQKLHPTRAQLLHANKEQAEEIGSLRRINEQVGKNFRTMRDAYDQVKQADENKSQQINSLQKDIDGMVRTHKQQVEKINALQTYAQTLLGNLDASRQAAESLAKQSSQPDWYEEFLSFKNIIVTRIAKLEESEKNLDADIAELFNTLNKLASAGTVDKTSPEDDVVYKNAIRAMRLDVPPTVTDISFVQTGAFKYKREIATSKEFSAWCSKWSKELFELMGGV